MVKGPCIISCHHIVVKKSDSFLIHDHAIVHPQIPRIISRLGQSLGCYKVLHGNGVSHEWSWNQENIFAIKKCGDINPFHRQFLTPLLSLEHLTLMIQAGLLYSWRFQISSCDCNPSRAERHAWRPQSEVGLSPLEQGQCEATHLFRAVILSFVRIVDWMMWHFLLIPKTDK